MPDYLFIGTNRLIINIIGNREIMSKKKAAKNEPNIRSGSSRNQKRTY